MSRVGKLPVAIPQGVQANVEGQKVTIKGSKGELSHVVHGDVHVSMSDGKISVSPANDSIGARAQWGTARALINNMVEGVSKGFSKRLEIIGVGFRAAVDKGILSMSLGYSHEIKYAIPAGITIVAEKPTSLLISGADVQKVGEVAAQLSRLRKRDPYKDKGVHVEGIRRRMKEGKKK